MNIKKPPMPKAVAFTDSLETTSERGWLNAMAWAWDEMQIPLHSADQLAARDAEWLKLVEPVVEALDYLTAKWRAMLPVHKDAYLVKHREQMDAACAALAAITEEQQ